MRILSRFLSCALPLALAACASTHPVARSTGAAPALRGATITDDAEYVARVNAEARRRGLMVQWINPPMKRTAVAGNGPQ